MLFISINSSKFCFSNKIKRPKKLKKITILAKIPPTISSDIINKSYECVIYVPTESLDTYKTSEGWSEFADKIKAIPE